MESKHDKDNIEKEWNMEYGIDYFTYRGMKPSCYPNPDDSIKKFVLFMVNQKQKVLLEDEIKFLKANEHYLCRCITTENIVCEIHKRLNNLQEELKNA